MFDCVEAFGKLIAISKTVHNNWLPRKDYAVHLADSNTCFHIKNAFGLRTQTPAKTRCKLIKKVTASIAISALVLEDKISLRIYTMMCTVSNSFVLIDFLLTWIYVNLLGLA